MRVHVVDPAGLHAAYDHALCAALARAGADVDARDEPLRLRRRSRPRDGYAVDERFYRFAPGGAAARALRRARSWPSTCPTCCATAARARRRRRPLPVADGPAARRAPAAARPAARPHRPRRAAARAAPGPARAPSARLYERVDAVVVHSEHGRARLVDELGDRPDAACTSSRTAPSRTSPSSSRGRCRPSSPRSTARSCCASACCARTRASTSLLEAWRGIERRRAVGRRHAAHGPRAAARRRAAGRALRRALRRRRRAAGVFRRADLVVLPYREIDQSGVLFTALALRQAAAAAAPSAASPRSPRPAPPSSSPPGDPAALHGALRRLLDDPGARASAGGGARCGRATRRLRLGRDRRAPTSTLYEALLR